MTEEQTDYKRKIDALKKQVDEIKEYLKRQIEITKDFLELGEGKLPLKNVLAHDMKLLAVLEGKSWEEACKIQEETMNKKY